MPDPSTLSDGELSAICRATPFEKRIGWIGVGLSWAVWLITVELWSPVQKYGGIGVVGAIVWLVVVFAIITYGTGIPYRWRAGRFRKELLRRCDLPQTGADLQKYIAQRRRFDDADWVVLVDAQFLPHGGRGFMTLTVEKDSAVSLRMVQVGSNGQSTNLSCVTIPVSAETAVRIREQVQTLVADHAHFSPEKAVADGMPLRFIAYQPTSGTTIRYAFNLCDVDESQKQIPVVKLTNTALDVALGTEDTIVSEPEISAKA